MRGFLLDTNVVSEIVRAEPAPRVLSFLAGQSDLWLSVIVLHELDFGLKQLPQGRRRRLIEASLSEFVTTYEDRILPVERREAEQAALFRAQSRRSGRVLHLADALIAGTAKAHDLVVATRNVDDFDNLGISVTNPWERLDWA